MCLLVTWFQEISITYFPLVPTLLFVEPDVCTLISQYIDSEFSLSCENVLFGLILITLWRDLLCFTCCYVRFDHC